MLTYIPVSFCSLLFSFKNFVPVTVKNRVRVRVAKISAVPRKLVQPKRTIYLTERLAVYVNFN